MATIYDIAKLCNLSASTVSYVLNGTGDKHRISKATQENVRAAANRLNYHPNLSARSLSNSSNKLRIAFLWPEFYFEQTIISGMHAIRDIYRAVAENLEIHILFFIPDHLMDKLDESVINGNNGIVLLGASLNDLKALSTQSFQVPLVIANRTYEGFPSVSIDNFEAGQLACDLLCDRFPEQFISVWETQYHVASNLRRESFLARCAERGENIEGRQFFCDGTSEDGHRLGLLLAQKKLLKKAIFCNNESVSAGIAGALQQCGYQLGTDVFLLSTNNGPSSFCQYYYPPISAIELKMEDVLVNAFRLCLGLVKRSAENNTAMMIRPEIAFRETFPQT